MLSWALAFFIVAIIAAIFGFTGIGTALGGGGTTCARAATTGAYKSAPATRPRRVEMRIASVMLVSELSRARIR